MRRGILLVAAVLAAACAGPQVQRPPRQEASIEASRRTQELYARGDFAAALKQAQRAHDLAASVEDEDGLAVALLSLSTIYQRLDQPLLARTTVDRLLAPGGLRFSPQREAEAALRRAVLAADDGDASTAQALLTRAEQACGEDCALAGKFANLRAQLAIEAGRLDEARAEATRAEAASRAHHDAEETANALRLTANALILQGLGSEAAPPLEAALLIDKRIGASRKVYRDLLLLGLAARQRGDATTATDYLRRAADVARADGFRAGLAEAEGLLKQ